MSQSQNLAKLVPAALFAVVAAAFAAGLAHDPKVIPSMLIDRPLPAFTLPPLVQGDPPLASATIPRGRLTLINVFASWCGTCRQEHTFLLTLAGDARFTLVGLNWKDDPAKARRFIETMGNPYASIGQDPSGRTGINLDVSGVPETFVVDHQGRVRLRVPGPMSPEIWRQEIEPLLRASETVS
jgi:cytochrome c biogenesis protein CcmG/thiol:disulfide interchange protein DsbE